MVPNNTVAGKYNFCEVCGRSINPKGQLLSAPGNAFQYLEWPQPSCLKYTNCKWRKVRNLLSSSSSGIVDEIIPGAARVTLYEEAKSENVAPNQTLGENIKKTSATRSTRSNWFSLETPNTVWKLGLWLAGAFFILFATPVGFIVGGAGFFAAMVGAVVLLFNAIFEFKDLRTCGLKLLGVVGLAGC